MVTSQHLLTWFRRAEPSNRRQFVAALPAGGSACDYARLAQLSGSCAAALQLLYRRLHQPSYPAQRVAADYSPPLASALLELLYPCSSARPGCCTSSARIPPLSLSLSSLLAFSTSSLARSLLSKTASLLCWPSRGPLVGGLSARSCPASSHPSLPVPSVRASHCDPCSGFVAPVSFPLRALRVVSSLALPLPSASGGQALPCCLVGSVCGIATHSWIARPPQLMYSTLS